MREHQDWRHSAVCAQVDPEVFTLSVNRKQFPEAKAICATCPVRTECLEDAMASGEVAARDGMAAFAMFQAGLTPKELSVMFRRSGRAAAVKRELFKYDAILLDHEVRTERFRSREEFWEYVSKEGGRKIERHAKDRVRADLSRAALDILSDLPNMNPERRSAASSKLTEEDVRTIRRKWKEGVSAQHLGLMFAVGRITAYQAATGATWSHLTDEEDVA